MLTSIQNHGKSRTGRVKLSALVGLPDIYGGERHIEIHAEGKTAVHATRKLNDRAAELIACEG